MTNMKSRIMTICMGVFVIYYLMKIFGHVSTMEFVSDLALLGLLIKLAERNMRLNLYEDKMTFPAMGLGVVVNILISTSSGGIYYQGISLSLAGLFLGGFLFYLVGIIGKLAYRTESIGGGDIKLAAAIGAFIGPSILWFVAIWICIWGALPYLFVATFLVVCRLTTPKQRGLIRNQRLTRASVIPSAPIHFVALTGTLLIKRGFFDFMPFLLSFSIVVIFAFLFSSHADDAKPNNVAASGE